MELQTVSMVMKKFGISSRMLSYYEQAGLIKSQKTTGYSYRVFDQVAVNHLQQIIVLRKLQIPVKQIRVILSNPKAATMVEIFQKNIHDIDGEITALSTIRNILTRFVGELEQITSLNLNLDFLGGDSVLALTGALSLTQKNIKENVTMNELDKASELLSGEHNESARDRFMNALPQAAIDITFDGNCREAMEFYAKVFKIEMPHVLTFGELPPDPDNPIAESEKDRVAVADMRIYNANIRFFDCPSSGVLNNCPFVVGNNINLRLEIAGAAETTRVFNELKEGGAILIELQEQFFAALHGIVKDRFGVNWNILGH